MQAEWAEGLLAEETRQQVVAEMEEVGMEEEVVVVEERALGQLRQVLGQP